MANASLPHFKSVIKLDHYREAKKLALISSSNPSQLVRSLLQQFGHTEESLACAASVNQSTISRILSGKTRDPKFSIIQKLLTCLSQESACP